MRYDLVIFDMDGTLTDSYLSITKTFQHTLRETLGLEIEDLDAFRPFIGPPLGESLATYDLRGPELTRAMAVYRAHYLTTLDDTVVYPGISELLIALKEAGAKLAVASNKQTEIVCQLLERDGLAPYFDFVTGADDSRPGTKADAIQSVLDYFALKGYRRAVMIGDRYHDAAGAEEAGVDFAAAGYGPGSREEFAPYPMVFYAQTVAELERFLLE